MSTERPPTNYQRAFYFLSVVMILTIGMLGYTVLRLKQTEAERGNPRFLDPSDLSEYRDKNYSFTVTNNGYTYQGKTGNYIDEHVLCYGRLREVHAVLHARLRASHRTEGLGHDRRRRQRRPARAVHVAARQGGPLDRAVSAGPRALPRHGQAEQLRQHRDSRGWLQRRGHRIAAVLRSAGRQPRRRHVSQGGSSRATARSSAI